MTSRFRAAAAGLCVTLMLVSGQPAEAQPVPHVGSQATAILFGDPTTAPIDPEFIPSPNNLLRVDHMVVAASLFTLIHELGHLIVDDYDVPVIGQEENGVDRFATLQMTARPKAPGSAPDTFDPATDPESPLVIWAAWWWHEKWRRQQAEGEAPDYANRHGLNIARSVEVMCLVYGSDPERFEQPFRAFLPEVSREGCIDDAAKNQANWGQVLAVGGPWWKYEARVAYNPAPWHLAEARTALMEAQVLELFADIWVNQLSVPPRAIPEGDSWVLGRVEPYRYPIDVVADECRDLDGTYMRNAFWDPNLRRIVLCYAYVDQLQTFSREAIARTEIGQREKMPE